MIQKRFRRLTALLLAAVCLLSLLPVPARAEDSTIKLKSITWTSGNYQSAYFERPCQIQDFHMQVGGLTLSGFCGDHSKRLNNSHIGDAWSNPQSVTNDVVKIMMSYYYTHLLGEEYWNDECIAKGFNYQISGDAILQYNGWIQEVVWLWSTDQIPSDFEGQVEMVAQAYRESFDARNGTHHDSIDDQIVASSPNTFKSVTEMILSNPTAWCECPVYEYFHPDSTVQPILVGYPQKVTRTETPGDYSLTVRKVDSTNPNLPLAGATFRIVSTTDQSFTPRTGTTGTNGTYTFENLPAGIYAVTETVAPSGYTIDHAGPDYVTLPGNGENMVEKVFTDTPTITVSGSIRKVDADDPSKGLAGATIAIQGVDNSFYGEFTTGEGGALEGLEWSSLRPGSYRAWETSAPEGYSLNPGDVKTFRISAETPEVQLVFENDAKVKVQLVKLDDSDNPLPGAVFNILRDGQIIGTEETDVSGKITVNDVETGMYVFVEVSAPAGYAKLDEPVCVYVNQEDIEGGSLITVTATDKKLPDLTIQKKDAATGAAVPNTTFEIVGVHTGYQQEVTTGDDGTATLTGIPVDYYEVTEKNVPTPYTLSPERTQTVWLGAGEHPTLVFNNLEEPKLSILKLDAETSTPIPGVVFNVQGIDVEYQADWTTGDDGKYTAQITPGSYRITETSVPAPYSLDSRNVRTVALVAGSERELVFENLKNPLLNLTKIDALDGRVVPGTVFAVVGVDNSYTGDWTTGADGTVSERVEPGTYRITEKSVPAPYYLPENDADRTQTVSLRAGEVRGLVFKNYKTPTLWIYKLDAVGGAPIEGAKFHVTYTSNGSASGAPETYDFGELYTNSNGEIPLHETGVRLYPGEYTVTEVAPAPGFQMREPTRQTVHINGSESRSVTFYNAPLNAIIVEKYDAVTGQAVPGATFRLRYLSGTSGTGGTTIGEKTTGPSGSAIWTGLEAGTYIVEEIRAPEGYNIVQSSQTVYLAANGEQSVVTVSFENSPDGGLLIRKIDAKTRQPMAGIEFLVTDSKGTFIGNGNGKFITDSNGSILIGNVTPGTTLVVRETQTLPGYILDTTPQTCVIQEGKTTTLEFRNEPDGTIIIYKKDAVTGAALAGVQFTVTRGNGELVAIADGMISSNGIYYTDENGQIILRGIEPDTYVITETATISGYILDRTPHTIAVTAGDTQTLTVTNQPKGGLLIRKYDRVTRTALAGAEFRIVPADSALAVDNEGLTSATNLYVTDENGQIAFSNLTPGAYMITETKAPDGYSVDSEAQTIVVRSGRTETVSFYDSPLATLQILKRDAVSGQPLADAEFTVTTADGTRIGENNGIFVTDEDGTATVTNLAPNSAVIVSETTSPAGYVLNATPKSIIVRSGSVNSLVFNDEPKTTLIVHKYIAGTRNTPLAGVEFKVTNSKGEVLGMNNGIYTTDATGDFMVTGLDPGLTVTVRETRTADGYVLDGTPQNIVIKAGERQELTFWNQHKGTLIVRKLDSETGNPISGVEFKIAYADGKPVDRNNGLLSSNGQYFTDNRGEILLTDVIGTIVVTEVKTAKGYYIDPSSRTQTVVVNPDDAQTVTFFNTPTQTLTLQKYEADSTTPISGVSFHITDSEGNSIGNSNGDFTTDRNGQIILNDLIPGTTIIARETSVPADYVLDATPHSILIRTDEAQTLTVYNQRRGNLIVRKIDSATGEALANAQFKITTADGGEVTGFTGATANNGYFTTDRTGQITLNKLAPGAYIVTETQAPEGYVLNAQPQTVVLGAAETKTVTFGNAVKGSLIVQKFDSVTRQPLSGTEFKVAKTDGTLVANNGGRTSSNGIYVTDASGQITLSGLDPASYVVTETKAPENYYLNTQAQTVVVTADDVQTVSFYDEPFASLTIVKRDSVTQAPLSGAEFSVKDSGGELIANCVTGTDGTATVSGLTPRASLVVTETHAPAGYVLSEKPQTIRVKTDSPNTVTFEDAPTSTLIIRKFISGTANEPLPGVAFKIIDGSGKNVGPDDGVYYTDHAGEITLTGLTPGAVIKAREIRTVEGFALDGTPQDIEIQAGQTQQLTFYNARKGSLKIRKLDSVTGKPLSGVMFHITTASGEDFPNNTVYSNGYFTTDAAGEILLTGVSGTLDVTEFSTISGYVIDEASRTQTVTVGPESAKELVFYNEPMTTLTVQKYIAGTTTPLKGARFLVTDSHGMKIGPSGSGYTTDEHGRFVLSDLIPGLSVVVKEIEAPEGYVLDSTPQTVRIQGGTSAQTLTFYNAPKGSISVRKLDSVTGQPISGVEFKVTSSSGEPLDNDGGKTSTNGIYRTDEHGQFLITKVEPGIYTLVETSVPNGYILDPTPLTVTVKADDAQTITIRNKPKQTLTVRKFAAGTTNPLSGVEFLVTDSRGTKLGPSNGVYTTDAHGQFVVSGLTPGQTVTVKETKTLSGYVLDTTPQTISIGEGDAQTLTFYNSAQAALKIIKRDSVTLQPLSGARFQVLTADGKYVDNLGGLFSSNGIYTTDASGEILLTGLNPGVLVVKETAAPDGYVLDDTPQTVELKDAETQTLTFANVPKQTVTINKFVEGTTQPLSGVTFLVTDGGGNKLGEYVTDASGRIEISGINPGTTVIAREIKTASGYAMNGEPQSIEVKVGAANAMTFYDEPLSVLVIKKFIEGTANEPLAGVAFKVTDGGGANVGTDDGIFYTDNAGEIRIENLEAGTVVKAQEIKTVDGFVLDGTPQDVKIQSGTEHEMVFWNKRVGMLTVRKLDSVTRLPLSGVEFKIAYADGRKIGDSNGIFTTDSRGEINITGLNGTVTVTETATIPGYVMGADRTQTVTVNPQTAKTVTFTNDPMQTLTIRKFIRGTTTPISGAVFMISDSTGAALGRNNGEFSTDEHGEIVISGLIPGTTVTAREVRPASGFALHSDAQSINIKQGDAQTLTFYNTPLENLTIRKLAEGTDKPLSGVVFYVTDGAGTPIGSGEFVTDNNGQILIPGLVPGTTIIAREVKTVKGYSLNGMPKNIEIQSGKENALTFYDSPLATLVLHKYVEGTENQPLPGVTFKVVDGTGKNIGSTDGLFVTDAAGDITISDLEPGTVVKAREVKTVDGYVLDGTPQDIQIQGGELHELTFYNAPKKGLVIHKYIADSTTPIPGVTFHISDVDGAAFSGSTGDFITDANGEIILSGLTPGDVLTVKETKAARGFVLDSTPQSIRINRNGGQSLVFYNAPKGSLTIRKIDAVTERSLSGAEFKITTLQGEPLDDYEGRVSTGGIYRTDENGKIVLLNVQPGAYRVTETKAPEGYVLDAAAQTVTVNPDDAQTLVFRDNALQSVTIRKYIEGTTKPLAGVTFMVTDANGGKIGEYVTDENGEIVISGLTPGMTLVAREVKTVKGYALNGTPQTIQVGTDTALQSAPAVTVRSVAAVNSGSNSGNSMTFYDEPLSTLVIHKYVTDTENQPLPGVTFKVVDGNGANVGNADGIYTTDESGEIVIPNLERGTVVKVREIRTVNGYLLDGTPQDIQIRNSELHELTFWNDPVQTLTIRKYAADTSTPLPGVTFHVTGADGKNIGSSNGDFITDRNGEIVISGLTPGDVLTVKETKTVSGYVLDSTPQTVKIQSGEAQTLTLYNAPKGSLIVRKTDAETGDPIFGAEFGIFYADGRPVDRSTESEYDGPFAPVVELLKSAVRRIPVIGNSFATSSGGHYFTNDMGEIVINGITGTIIVTELNPAEGYAIDPANRSKTVTVSANDAQTLVFSNPRLLSLTIHKRDSVTKKPLADAEFSVKDSGGEIIGTYTTGKDGTAVVSGLTPNDTVVVTETEAPAGYVKDAKPQTIKVQTGKDNSLTFENAPTQTLAVQKYATGTTSPISGAAFLVVDDDGKPVGESNGEYLTDENGRFVLTGLTPGATMTVKEIRAAEGYVLDGTPKSIKIKSGAAQSLTFYNAPLQNLTITKYIDGTTKPLAGVTFLVTDANGASVGAGEYMTDSNGRITISGLTPGMTLVVRETKTVKGYVLNSAPQTIQIGTGSNSVTAGEALTSSTSTGSSVTFYDEPLSTLVVHKYVTGTDNQPIPGVTFKVLDGGGKPVGNTDGIYVTDAAGDITIPDLEPGTVIKIREIKAADGYLLDGNPQDIEIQNSEVHELTFWNTPKSSLTVVKLDSLTEKSLSGAEFKVTTADGAAVDQDEGRTSTNGIYRTDESGRFTISGLLPGSYVVTETKAPQGYVLNTEPQTVKVNANDAQTLTFRNAPVQTLNVEVYVTDSTTPIPGITFLVVDQNGKPIGNSNGEFIADENGRITIPGLTPGVSITVKEIRAADGFILDGMPKTILIQSGEAQSLRFYNSPAQTLAVQLYETGTATPISGAAFHIVDGDGKNVGSSNGDFVTDKDGRIVISGLIPGTSIIAKETQTVSGYVLDTMPQTIAIHEGEAQTLVFYNATKGALVLKARDSVTEQLIAGVEFRITTANGEPLDSNEGKTSSNGFYRTDETGQLTLTKLQPGIYSIVETSVPDGYVLNTEPQTITINADDTQTLTFTNTPKQTLTIQVYEEGTTKPIPGIAFLLKDSGGAFIGPDRGEYVTDANGQITVSGLTPGVTVEAQEIRTVTGYVLNNVPQNIKIETGDAQKLTYFNVSTQILTIQKFQKGTTKPLQGVAFLVVDGSGAPIGSGEYVTDENGRISIDGLEPGTTITAREIRTVKGYQLNGNPQNIQIASGKENVLMFYDDPLCALIIRLFIDGTENEPVSGAAFKVVDGSGKSVGPDDGVYYTDKAGMITLNNLEPGVTIKARLIKIAEEFVLDGTPQDILMESGDAQSLTFWAKRAGSLTIRSLDSVTRQPIPNVEFKVIYADGRPVDTANGKLSSNGQYFTDTNGEIHITGVTGTLVVTEEKTADSYTMDAAHRSQTVVVRADDGQTLTFFDTPAQGLTVQLYVKGTTTPISGARFLLTDGTGAKLGDEDGEFTTDENGRFSLTGLKPGVTVKVKQISTVDGYLNDSAAKTVTIKTGNEQTVTVYNSPKQSLTVKLYEKGTTTPIAGGKFLLKDSGGTLVGENNGVFTTDRNGEFSITGLSPGVTITATQTDTISGYVLDSTPQSILIKSGNAQSLTFYNSVKGALTVRKIDAMTEKPLAGAEFKIVTIGGAPVDDNEGKSSTNGIYRTDENGEITILKLQPGVYTVTETKAPAGYTLDSQPQTVTVNENDRQTLTFRDTALQSLTITKYEEGTAKPLAGVTFLITDANGGRIGAGEYTTDRNGQITITGLAPGMTVIAREVRTVKGYVLNGNPQTITIGTGANNVTSGAAAGTGAASGSTSNNMTFYDEPLSVLVIHKYVEGTDNEPLSNAEFKITDGKGAAVGKGTYYTDKSGEIRVENLEPGMTVTVRETKAASGYLLDGTPQTATIPSGDVLEMTFWNSRQQTLTINKYVTGTTTPIKGTAFLITDQTGAPVGASNGEFVTDENGRIVVSGLTPGMNLTVKETRAADGYALDSTPKSILIKSGEAQSLNFYNSPTGTLIVEKRDKATDKPLKGATFQILTADGKFVPNAGGQLSSNGIYTTDDKGQIILTGLSTDTLVVKETKAPSGYLLDDTPQTVKVGPNDTQTLKFYDEPEKVLTIQKFETGTTKPIQGVTFLVTDSTGAAVGNSNGEFQTDRNGRVVLSGLTPGTTITAKEVRTVDGYVLDTTPQSILIKEGEAQVLTFYNSVDGGLELIKVDAADSTIRIPNTTFEIRKMDCALVKKITTGRDGRIHTDLDAGDYYLVEIEAANGYKLDATPEYFTVKDGKTTTVTVKNTAVSGILLHKTDAVTGKGLYGVAFLLYDAKNNPIGQYTTDDKGYIRIEGLDAGKYSMRELENKGYIPDTQLKTVYVKSGETTLIEWKNIPVTAQIQITKRSADYNSTNGLPAGTLLEGAVFEIRDKASNLVDTVKTDKNGLAVSKPLPLGRYTIRETKAPANYGVNETEWTAYLEHEGQIVRFEITDKSLVTGVSITKTGPKQVMNGQPVIYRFSGIGNTSNVRLDSFYWRDTIPAQVRLTSVMTGTYNFPGTYKITYRVNGGEPKTLADNLSTQKNYTLAASSTALGLKSDERVTEIMFVFGQAPAGFAQVEAPVLNCTAISNILANSFVNEADVGGVYNGQWVQGVSRWVTTVYKKPVKLPRTGY